jgi:imidazolonepropionase-like amidohydrolase
MTKAIAYAARELFSESERIRQATSKASDSLGARDKYGSVCGEFSAPLARSAGRQLAAAKLDTFFVSEEKKKWRRK